MNVTFPQQHRWDLGWEYMEFPAEVDGGTLACRITLEALVSRHGAAGPTQQEAERAFLANREAIEREAREAIQQAGRPVAALLLTTGAAELS